MQIKLLGWIAIAFLGVIVVATAWFFLAPKPAPPPQGGANPITLPTSSSTPDGSQGGMTVFDQTGTALVTRDFIGASPTTADPSNPGNYILTPQDPDASFSVYYVGTTNYFIVTLLTEPLGEARREAEDYLAPLLGVSKAELCRLNYYVGVTRYVNETFTGQNLGFTACADTVMLP